MFWCCSLRTSHPSLLPQSPKVCSVHLCLFFCFAYNRSSAQVGCMRQVLGPGALGRPRGIGWRGRWECGTGWGTRVNPWLIHVNVWQKPLQYHKIISLQLIKINGKKKRKLQLTTEQPSAGECWIPPKKIPHIQRQRKSPNKTIGGEKNHIYNQSPHPPETLGGLKQNLVHNRTQGPVFECLSVPCGGTGQQWPAAGTGTLDAKDLGGAVYGLRPLGGCCH